MSLTRGLSRKWDQQDQVSVARARAAFRASARTMFDEPWREREIAALPQVEWKGRRLRTIRCHGETGNGPHDINVPESLLWSLIGLTRFKCSFHG